MKNNFWLKLQTPSNSPFRKGGEKKQPIIALAPMAGITDSAFRQICRRSGADVVYTEMISADGLYYDGWKTLAMLDFDKSEQPAVIQLFGKDPSKFTKAAQLAEQAGFSGVDINFGCPAKKVAGHGGGVTLMRDLPKCRQIIEAVLAGTRLPVSVKLRTSILMSSRAGQGGVEEFSSTARENLNLKILNKRDSSASLITASVGMTTGVVTSLDFLQFMSDLPLAAVMIHGRSYEKPFDGEIDYAMIKKCVQSARKYNLQLVILGNGGIKTPEDAQKMIEETGCDGVGLARGLYGRPWLFKQCRDYFKQGKYREPSLGQIKKVILEHAQTAFKAQKQYGLIELRKHLLWYVSGWPQAKELRSKLVKVESIADVK
ncbi:MAG: tRNA-dihydrouridine synthase, partial [Patescibacteria group bacterium]